MGRRPRTQSRNETTVRPKAERRKVPDRRRLTRQGRRGSDPQPRCPSCGLLAAGGPHASKTACIKALRAEIERLIARAPIVETDPEREQ
jgi:hypothetical protein